MNMRTIIVCKGIFADESITRLVKTRARQINKFHPEYSSCRVVIDPQRSSKGTGMNYRVRLYISRTPGFSTRLASPGFLEIHALTRVMKDAVNDAFDKAEELLSPRLNPVPGRAA